MEDMSRKRKAEIAEPKKEYAREEVIDHVALQKKELEKCNQARQHQNTNNEATGKTAGSKKRPKSRLVHPHHNPNPMTTVQEIAQHYPNPTLITKHPDRANAN